MKREGWTWSHLQDAGGGVLCDDAQRRVCERVNFCGKTVGSELDAEAREIRLHRCRRVSVEVKEVKARR
jgi:hypothetical protein